MHLINIFPTLNVLRELGSQKNVSIGYNRNILRMSSIAYNSQLIYKGYMNGTVGNKDLKPRITNYIYLQFYLKSHVLSANYKWHTNHRIFVPLDAVQPYIMRATTYNHLKQFYLNYNKDFQLSKSWSSNLGMYGYYNQMDNSDLSFFNKQAINYQLDWYNTFTIGTYRIEVGLNYNSPYKTEWGKLKPILYNNLVLNKVLMDNTWDIRLTVNDLLGVAREGAESHYPLLYRSEGQINHQRSIGLQLTYRFPFGKKTLLNKYQSDLKDEIRN